MTKVAPPKQGTKAKASNPVPASTGKPKHKLAAHRCVELLVQVRATQAARKGIGAGIGDLKKATITLLLVERGLDDSINSFDSLYPRDGVPNPGGLLSEQMGMRVFALCAYLGEAIRRKCGGIWIGDDEDPEATLNVAVQIRENDCIWPMQRVMRRELFPRTPTSSLH